MGSAAEGTVPMGTEDAEMTTDTATVDTATMGSAPRSTARRRRAKVGPAHYMLGMIQEFQVV